MPDLAPILATSLFVSSMMLAKATSLLQARASLKAGKMGLEGIVSKRLGSHATVYTLYRNSVFIENARLHVATFDTADGEPYNSENCQAARDLFQQQPGVKTRFW